MGRSYVRQAFRLFFSHIHVKGIENIPSDRPIILAPNHQNALLDALAAMHGLRGVQVFMARADIFKNRHIAKVLRFLKIMPVFRMRDGYENLGKNDEIFDQAAEVLRESRFLCIMPEGTHSEYHRLRPLVKGMFRLAFKYIMENPGKPAPVIIPVGIDYSSYSAYRSTLFVQYGKPIDCLDFYTEFLKNAPLAINQLRDILSEELKKYMIHIESIEYYEQINFLRKVFRYELYKNYTLLPYSYKRFLADKSFTNKCNSLSEETLKTILIPADRLKKQFEKFDFNASCFQKTNPIKNLVLLSSVLLIAFPIFALAYLFHFLPLHAPKLLTKKISDIQFHGSVKFVVSAFLFPLWYITFGLIFAFCLQSFLFSLAFMFMIYLAGEFSIKYYSWYKKLKSNLAMRFNPKEFYEAKNDYKKIKHILNI